MSDDDGQVWIPTYSTGSYGGLDDRHKRRGKKQPIGFSPPQAKKPTPKKRKR